MGSCSHREPGQLTSPVQGDPGLGRLDGRGRPTSRRAPSCRLLQLSGGEASPASLSLEKRTVSSGVLFVDSRRVALVERVCSHRLRSHIRSGRAYSRALTGSPSDTAFPFAPGESGAAGNPQWRPLSLAPGPYPAVQPRGPFLALRLCLLLKTSVAASSRRWMGV